VLGTQISETKSNFSQNAEVVAVGLEFIVLHVGG